MVRVYFPQKTTGSISANSNYSPQGGQILVPEFPEMENEDFTVMENEDFTVMENEG